MMANYLVTGGAGFIGSNLVEALVREGTSVRVLDDFSTGRRENLDGFLGDIDLVESSITVPATCASACEGIDFVLHQAALSSVPRSVANPGATHEVCATGTLNPGTGLGASYTLLSMLIQVKSWFWRSTSRGSRPCSPTCTAGLGA